MKKNVFRMINVGRRVALKADFYSNTSIFLLSFKQEMLVNNALFKIENLKQMTLYCFTIEIELKMHLYDRIPGLQRIPECYRTPMSGISLFSLLFLYNGDGCRM